MVKLADIFRTYGYAYLKKHQQNILPSHRKAIYDISSCRTPAMGGQVYKCNKCDIYHFSYHSCGNRHCNTCQNDKAEEWLNKNNDLLLPVNYFMITFTLPEELRQLARSNQRLFYKILFDASSASMDKLSPNPKYLGGKPGYLGVLHTWSRKLVYHPHIHYIITGGGLSEDSKWIYAKGKFLFPVKALSLIFKAKFRDQLKLKDPELFSRISPGVWKRSWVVNSISVGNGIFAMKYLAQYVFRVAISNNRIVDYKDGIVTFKYKDSETKAWKFIKVTADEFMRRFLQHILPRGFVKVRYFGLFASKNRSLLNNTKKSLPADDIKLSAGIKGNRKSDGNCCPKCGKEMQLILEFNRVNRYSGSLKNFNKAPPLINNLQVNNEQLQRA